MGYFSKSSYRIYCSEDNLKMIAQKVKATMTLRYAATAIGYVQPNATYERVWSVPIEETNDNEFGGKVVYDECLDDFMKRMGIPLGSSLDIVNKALIECGFKAVNIDNLEMSGQVVDINKSFIDAGFIDITTSEVYSIQADFIKAIKEALKGDPKLKVEWTYESMPDEFKSNVEGALYGDYISYLDGDIERHETLEEALKYVKETLVDYNDRNGVFDGFLDIKNVEEANKFLMNVCHDADFKIIKAEIVKD